MNCCWVGFRGQNMGLEDGKGEDDETGLHECQVAFKNGGEVNEVNRRSLGRLVVDGG
jgi:hypothetical protein